MTSISEEFADRFTRQRINLNRLEASILRKVVSIFRRLEIDLADKIRRFDLEGVSRASAKRRRMERLFEDVKRSLRRTYRTAEQTLTKELVSLGSFTAVDTARLINEIITVNLLSVDIDPATIRALARRPVVLGLTLKEDWDKQLEGTRRRFVAQMRLGVLQGETNDELVTRVIGGRTGRRIKIIRPDGRAGFIAEFGGGVLDTTRAEARTLVRTSVQSISNAAQEEIYRDNADIVKGLQALATLDLKTSEICIARAGSSWNLETGEPFPDSPRQETYPGPPPWHPNCRTVLIPVLFTWEEIIERATGQRFRILEDVPSSVRASMDGEVSGTLTTQAWLRRIGDTRAARALGPGRFRLWKEGKITLSQLIDQSGRPLTVKELIARFGSAA